MAIVRIRTPPEFTSIPPDMTDPESGMTGETELTLTGVRFRTIEPSWARWEAEPEVGTGAVGPANHLAPVGVRRKLANVNDRTTAGPGASAMDDDRWEPGMPVLDRQPTATPQPRPVPNLPPSLQGLPPRSVPEVAPTPLQKHFVLLSVPVLIAGAIAITALELGVPLGSPLVKLCVIVGAPLLVITTADATVRIWRSAWAWMPVNPGRGAFRLAWVVVSVIGLVALMAASVAVILA
jgi:hypothetical protein